MLSTINYITNVLKNESAALRLVDDIETSILKRLENPLAFEPYRSAKKRNYVVYYVVIGDVMEVRRLIYGARDINRHL